MRGRGSPRGSSCSTISTYTRPAALGLQSALSQKEPRPQGSSQLPFREQPGRAQALRKKALVEGKQWQEVNAAAAELHARVKQARQAQPPPAADAAPIPESPSPSRRAGYSGSSSSSSDDAQFDIEFDRAVRRAGQGRTRRFVPATSPAHQG
jgi:hypothetical protein